MNMKYILFIISTTILIMLFSCNKDVPYVFKENDTTRGIWGEVVLYDEFGNEVMNYEGVSVKAHCVDTIDIDTSGNVIVFDTIIYTTTDAKGFWSFDKAPGGNYTIEFLKDGYCKNQIYNYSYDTMRADTLDMLYLSVKPQGSIALDSISLLSKVLQISRTISFSTVQSTDYMLSTWYFFDTLPNVSSTQYIYSYVSGASVSNGGKTNSMTIKKPLDKLFENGIKAGQQVYVRAYIDNAKYMQYQIAEDEWVYPNLSVGSLILNFTMPEE